MKVLIDHQIFEKQRFGGISRYFVEIIKSFEKSKKIQWELPIKYSENNYLQQLASFNILPKPFLSVSKKNIIERIIDKFPYSKFNQQDIISFQEINKHYTLQLLKEGNFDVFHPTYYENYYLKYLGEKPLVLTVHDLIHQIFPEYMLANNEVDKTKMLLNRADHIIAISNQTKKDLIEFFDVAEEKISVIYHGCSISYKEDAEVLSRLNLPKKYLLFIGNRNIYKNVYFAIESIADYLLENPDLYIICTGHPFSTNENKYFEKLGLTEQIIFKPITEVELPHLYQGATAFIYPTLYEGFGLPILEAFACGCPVLCSNTSSLTEVAGDGAYYFNPKSKTSIIAAVKTACSDRIIRDQLISNGFKQLEKFSWSKTADETIKVYERVLTNK